jgi:lipase chaperone LimK
MNFDALPNKQLSQIEQLAKELLTALTKAKLGDELICKQLAALVQEATTERQTRFDAADERYKGF